ncbi:MAG: bifunctional 4-hydroxy-2-oxoglutarate aldolase/2-dehydro-3-deoxy-phosphogluconate aldolase [Myxococcales bacterium]|nr:bifunctional 4-hydroxy-2-oxoglutarate aldolase/2-dehydro-3-deoxy-phosphogluconate aldolase [Myxococcales bacterium]
MKDAIVERIVRCGIIPVIRAPSAELAGRAVEAVRAGGIDVVEVTMTVPGAVPLIEALVDRLEDDVLVGAGTVLDAETARACMRAGARFVVSPAFDEPTVDTCREADVVVVPGALTPTEIVRAVRAGADLVKVFPCGAMGGADYIRSLKAPLPDLRLVPTGGVSEKTIPDFIRAGATAVGIGSDLVDMAKLRDGGDAAIREAAARCVAAIAKARAARG